MKDLTLILTQIITITIISSIAISMIKDGGCKQVLKIVSLFAVIFTLLQYFKGFQNPDITDFVLGYSDEANLIAAEGEKITNDKAKIIIEEKCAAYILDKANEIDENIELTAFVETEWNESGFWYPTAATLEGAYDERFKKLLSDLISKELGIPIENQMWSLT